MWPIKQNTPESVNPINALKYNDIWLNDRQFVNHRLESNYNLKF